METYKAQLHRIWPKEDVQTWVTAFNECMQQTQTARDAALDAVKNKGQVYTSVELLTYDPLRFPGILQGQLGSLSMG